MNDTKYYVIMQGEYSDKGVVGITTDLELAKAYCKVRNAIGDDGWCGDYWIWDESGTNLFTDTSIKEEAKKVVKKFVYRFEADIIGGSKRWSICSKYETTEITTDTATEFIMDKGNEYGAELHVYADHKELADKIAYDFLAKKNAEEIGL